VAPGRREIGRFLTPPLPRFVVGLVAWPLRRWPWWLAIAALSMFLFLAMVVPSLGKTTFNSSDETSNYVFTQTFAEDWRLWYETDYLHLDEENLLHPRGTLTHEGRVVPFNYLGLPVAYGLIYKVAGDQIIYIAFVLALIGAWSLYRAASLLFGVRAWEAWVVALTFAPFLYYLNRPFMNATPAITAAMVGTWLMARYLRSANRRDLILASAALAFAIFCRYEYVLFVTPMVLWALTFKHASVFSRAYAKDVASYLVTLFMVFALPLMALNELTYGHFTTYGYSLFNDVYFPERTAEAGMSQIENAFRSLRGVLLPSYPFEPLQVVVNVPRMTMWIMPVFTVAAGIGIAALIKRRVMGWPQLAFLALMAFYVLIYRGSGNTFNAEGTEPTFNASVMRYWLPVYLLMFFLAAYGLSTLEDRGMKAVLVVALLLSGPMTVYSVADGSVAGERDRIERYALWATEVLVPNTEPNAVIYGSRSDKSVVGFRDAATWWNGAEFYDPHEVAASMARLHPTGRPVYIIRENEVSIRELNDVLAGYGLVAEHIEDTSLYRIDYPGSTSPAGR
jgi:hypothetical protein